MVTQSGGISHVVIGCALLGGDCVFWNIFGGYERRSPSLFHSMAASTPCPAMDQYDKAGDL